MFTIQHCLTVFQYKKDYSKHFAQKGHSFMKEYSLYNVLYSWLEASLSN